MASDLIKLIKELNVRTGAGLMDCKKALIENNEDIEKAITWLREKGIAKQAKKEGRIAAEGLTYGLISPKGDQGVIVEINSETDFVAKSDPFRNLVEKAAEICLAKKTIKTIEDLKANKDFTKVYEDACLKLGEKLSLRRLDRVTAKKGNVLALYIHMQGKITVLIEANNLSQEEAREIAMNVAANNPTYATVDQISKADYAKEKEVQVALIAEQDAQIDDPKKKFSSKPKDVQEKILKGKIDKIFAEQVLDEEVLIKNPDMTVKQFLQGKKASIVKFIRYQVGEGIQKREDNFAEEVMAQAK